MHQQSRNGLVWAKRFLHPLVVVITFALALTLASLLVAELGLRDSLLFLFIVPCILAAFFYDRWVYLSMQALTAAVGIWVISLVSSDFQASLASIMAAMLSSVILAEAIHALVTSRRRAEETLRQAEGRMRTFIEGASEMLYFQGLDGSLSTLNEANVRITGYSLEDFEADPQLWRKIVHPDDLKVAEEFFASHPEGVPSFEVEYRLRARSGEWRWIQSQMVGVKDATGRYIGYNCIDRDITAHKQAEAAEELHREALRKAKHELERQHARLEALYRIGQMVNSTLEPDAILDYLTDEAMRVTRATHGQVLVVREEIGIFERRSLRGFAPHEAELARTVPLPLDQGINGRAYVTGQVVCVDDVRTEADYYSLIPATRAELAVPIIREGKVLGNLDLQSPEVGAFRGVDLAYLDALAGQGAIALQNAFLVTKIREQARQVQQIMDTMPEGVLLLGAESRILQANPAAREYLAVLTDAGVGDVLTDLHIWPIQALLAPPPLGMLAHEIAVAGSPRQVFEVQAQPLEGQPGAGEWLLLIRDVTVEREMQKQIRQQERLAAVGQLSAGIAHDFNNILTSMIGLAQLVQMYRDVSAAAQEDLGRIVREGQRAAHLIRQILDFSRTSSGSPLPLKLVPFLKEITRFLERTIPERIHITLETADDEYLVHADPSQIQQVLTNLAVNARDAMPEGGELRLQLAGFTLQPGDRAPFPDMQPGEWVVLSVADTGVGIPPEVMPHIFEPFFTTKEVGEGAGLGLAQVYAIVRQHKGYVDVASQVGAGTTFTVYLPATQDKEVAAPAAPQETLGGQGETILLVEDEEMVLGVIRTVLERLGYRVLAAADGQEALAVHGRHHDEIALVLMDLVMPGMDGETLLQALRAQNPEVKVVAMTGYPLDGRYEQLLTQEAVSWIKKPLDQSRLAQALRQALG